MGGLICLGLIPLASHVPGLASLGVLVLVLLVVALVDRSRGRIDQSPEMATATPQ